MSKNRLWRSASVSSDFACGFRVILFPYLRRSRTDCTPSGQNALVHYAVWRPMVLNFHANSNIEDKDLVLAIASAGVVLRRELALVRRDISLSPSLLQALRVASGRYLFAQDS